MDFLESQKEKMKNIWPFNSVVVLIALQFGFAVGKPSEWVIEKSNENRELMGLVHTLDSMALVRDSLNLSNVESVSINQLVEMNSSPEMLYKIAVISKTLVSPAVAEHQDYDQIFDEVFWTCARKLSKRYDWEAVRYLSELKRIFGVDGAYSLQLRELVENQSKFPIGKPK